MQIRRIHICLVALLGFVVWVNSGAAFGQTMIALDGLLTTDSKRSASTLQANRSNESPAVGTLGGSYLLTADSLTVNADDPVRFNAIGTGLELELIGGDWSLESSNYIRVIGWEDPTVYTDPADADPNPFERAVLNLFPSNATVDDGGVTYLDGDSIRTYYRDDATGDYFVAMAIAADGVLIWPSPGHAEGSVLSATSFIGRGGGQIDGNFLANRFQTNGGASFGSIPIVADSVLAVYVLAKEDVHGYDAVYAGDPSGFVTGSPALGHLHSYGNIQANPRNGVRSNLAGILVGDANLTGNQGRWYSSSDGMHFGISEEGILYTGTDQYTFDVQTRIDAAGAVNGRLAIGSATIPSSGEKLQVIESAASTDAAISFDTNSGALGKMGSAGATNAVFTGTAAGDLFIAAPSGRDVWIGDPAGNFVRTLSASNTFVVSHNTQMGGDLSVGGNATIDGTLTAQDTSVANLQTGGFAASDGTFDTSLAVQGFAVVLWIDAGSATIANGTSSITVNVGQVTATDKITLLYPSASNGGGALRVQNVVTDTSFDIVSTANVSADTSVNWSILR